MLRDGMEEKKADIKRQQINYFYWIQRAREPGDVKVRAITLTYYNSLLWKQTGSLQALICNDEWEKL